MDAMPSTSFTCHACPLLPSCLRLQERQLRLLLQRGMLGPAARLMAAAWELRRGVPALSPAGGAP